MLGFFKLGLNNIGFYCFGQYSPCFRVQCSGERCTVILQMVFTSLGQYSPFFRVQCSGERCTVVL